MVCNKLLTTAAMDGIQRRFVCALFFNFISQIFGVVEIIEQSTPQLFKVGDLMTLKCISNEQQGLYWTRESPATRWSEERITIVQGSDWEERYLTIRPSGYVESILVRRHLKSGDGGNYFCYDETKEHSFSTFIHVLKVSYKNVTAHNSTSVTLECNLSGFTTNPPRIDHSWVRNDMELVSGTRSDKYEIATVLGTKLSLKILNPSKEDTGSYVCNFILYQKNENYVIYAEHVFLDADHLTATGNQVHPSTFNLVMLMCLALCVFHH